VSVEPLEVDARGLMCPLPLLRLKKALVSVEVGGTVRIQATDPAARLDFGVFVEQAGHIQIACEEEGEVLIFLIQKGR
jgi:tRNA 2-thiouridine synthesizing protein A